MAPPKRELFLDYGHGGPPRFPTAPWAFILSVTLFASWVVLELARIRLPLRPTAVAFLSGFAIAITFAAIDLRRPEGRHVFSAVALLVSVLGVGSLLFVMLVQLLFYL